MQYSTYENILNRGYQCIFEGLPDPVFFKNLYPVYHQQKNSDQDETKNVEYSSVQRDERKYIWGLKYKEGLDSDDQSLNERNYWLFTEQQELYENELRQWFSVLNDVAPNKIWGVVAVPSSNKNITNQVTKLINKCAENNFKSLTNCLSRVSSKVAAHSGGTRDRTTDVQTLAITNKYVFQEVDNIIVIDDVTTTGNTMAAVKLLFAENGIDKPTYNYVFGRTINAQSEQYYQHWQQEEFSSQRGIDTLDKEGKITGIVYDFDQTLVDSKQRNDEFERSANNKHVVFKLSNSKLADSSKQEGKTPFDTFLNGYPIVYHGYDGIGEFQDKGPIFAIVSNSGKTRCQLLLETTELQENIFPYVWQSHYSDKQNDCVKSAYSLYCGASYDEYPHSLRYDYHKFCNLFGAARKPAPDGVKEAIKWLKDHSEQSRIVGLGNTPEDLIAYHEAGIEAALAVWGVPESLRNFAKDRWGADISFDTFKEFADWIELVKTLKSKTAIIQDLKRLTSQLNVEPKETYIYDVHDNNEEFIQRSARNELKVENYTRLYTCHSQEEAVLKLIEIGLQEPSMNIKSISRTQHLNVWKVGQLFKGQEGWNLLNSISIQMKVPIYFSKKLNQAYHDNQLDNFDNSSEDTMRQNAQCLDVLKSWKQLGLKWPGIAFDLSN